MNVSVRPDLPTADAVIDLIQEAVTEAGYKWGEDIKIALFALFGVPSSAIIAWSTATWSRAFMPMISSAISTILRGGTGHERLL